MKKLIKITTKEQGLSLASARELHRLFRGGNSFDYLDAENDRVWF
jgi:hypothetical protein